VPPSNTSSRSTSLVSIEFPLPRRWSPFGAIIEPKILIEVQTLAGYRGRHVLVDTGADISVASRGLAPRIGHDWDRLPHVNITSIGPGQVSAKLGRLPLRIGGIELSVRCLFLDQRDVPYVLGCTDVLDRFVLTIDAGQRKIILTEIP
jgi:gag-polyprotein putative aspartyl protease